MTAEERPPFHHASTTSTCAKAATKLMGDRASCEWNSGKNNIPAGRFKLRLVAQPEPYRAQMPCACCRIPMLDISLGWAMSTRGAQPKRFRFPTRSCLGCGPQDARRYCSRRKLTSLESLITELDAKIEEATRPLVPQQERMSELPGIQTAVAQGVLAEVGADMTPFPTPQQVASWSGICPGNEASAGQRRSGRIIPGNRYQW